MIDREQRQFWLRQETLLWAAGLSGVIFAAVPIAAALCCLAGLIAYGVVWVAIAVFFLAGCAIAIGGIALGLVGVGEEDGGKGFGGLVLLAAGVLVLVGFSGTFPSMREAAETALAACLRQGQVAFQDVFLNYRCYAWPWAGLAFDLTAAGIVAMTLGSLRLGQRLACRLRRVHYACPHCYHRGLPAVRCPSCSNLVIGLEPSTYGVLNARCGSCHGDLPTLDCLGRRKLRQACARCSNALDFPGLGRLPEFHIAMAGAASSGKSACLKAALQAMATSFAPRNGIPLKCSISRFPSGEATAPTAITVSLQHACHRGSMIYLYDPSGRDYEEECRLAEHSFHRHLDGVIFVVDPFAEEQVRRHVAQNHGSVAVLDHVRPATSDALSVMSRLIGALERAQNLPTGAIFPFPIAVVLSKCEGSTLRGKTETASRSAGRAGQAAAAEVVRTFLWEQVGAQSFIRLLESRFSRVAYFVAGAPTSGVLSEAATVTDTVFSPLLWLGRELRALR